MSNQVIDKEWFLDRLAASNKSIRGLAKAIGIDPSAASRTLDGKRRMQMAEAAAIAHFLNVPVDDVIAHSGMPGAQIDVSHITFASVVGEAGDITDLPERLPIPQELAERARIALGSMARRMSAAQIRAAKGPLAMWDDAVVLFNPGESIDPAAIGVLSVAQERGGKQYLCRLDRARKTGEASLRLPDGNAKEVVLINAAPVLAIVP